GAVRGGAAESRPHAVEEACRPLFRLRRGACLHLQFLDTCIGALERLVLQQRRLHQRVNGMRSAPQTIGDQALRLRIALCGFELDQTIEQFIDELGFLRGHSVSPCLRTRWSCRWRLVALGGAGAGAFSAQFSMWATLGLLFGAWTRDAPGPSIRPRVPMSDFGQKWTSPQC